MHPSYAEKMTPLTRKARMVVALMPRLFEEAFKISLSPVNQLGYSFMRPALSFLEFSQCFTQAVAPSARG